MASKLVFFILTMSGFTVTQIAGQDGCRPEAVFNILLFNDILTWEDVSYEACEISYYRVTIEDAAYTTERTFQVTERSFNVTFLPPCEEYRFGITKVSTDNMAGTSRFYFDVTSPPPEVDFTLQYLGLSEISTWVQLEWALEKPQWEQCATRYRILVYDEDHDFPEDLYTSGSRISLTYLTPCTSYTFAVTAMYSIEIEGPPSAIRYRTAEVTTPAPSPVRFDVHSTRLEMTWEVAKTYLLNRCAVTSVNINASPYFSISYPVLDDPDNRRPFIITLPDLTPDTMYYMNITFTNAGGVSPGAQVIAQTLESD